MTVESPTLQIAVVGAGPAGLALALHAARALPQARVTVFDARAAERDISADPRTLALNLGSVQLLQRLGAWPAAAAQSILDVHISQAPPTLERAAVTISAAERSLPLLGAVLAYGPLVAALQRAWLAAAAAEPARLGSRFGTPVAAIRALASGVEVEAAEARTFDLAVVAEGGVFADQARKAVARDYRQTAWVGTVVLDGPPHGTAFERFTPQGPLALLPLPPDGASRSRFALVWCVDADDDPVRELNAEQRRQVLNALLPPVAGRVAEVGTLKDFALGLNAERTLVDGRVVRIGNAAQTLHPVAGQGLNLGLRDVYALVEALRFGGGLGGPSGRLAGGLSGVACGGGAVDAALRRVEWARAPDRWLTIGLTDTLARGFTWRAPGLGALRGAALAGLQALPPLKTALARQLMFGWR